MSSTNSFLNQVLSSESFSHNKSYSKDFVYSDGYNPKPTRIQCADSEFGFAGECTKLGDACSLDSCPPYP
jgi:hypothetical protein